MLCGMVQYVGCRVCYVGWSNMWDGLLMWGMGRWLGWSVCIFKPPLIPEVLERRKNEQVVVRLGDK